MAIKLTQQDLKYINEIKAYAIQNPEWFWSNSEDASEARQWLYSHGASGIVDEIYQETPDNIKQTIDNKKLSSSSQFDKFHEEWKDKQEDASKVVAGTLAASAAAPFAIGGLASAAGTGADKTLQQIRPDLETIIDRSNTLEKQHRDALRRINVPGVGMILDQPIAGFRRFKLGGHMPKYFRMFGK